MSKTQLPGSTLAATGHGAVHYHGALEQSQQTAADSLSSGNAVRQKVSIELPQSVSSSIPYRGYIFRLYSLFAATIEDVIRQILILETCNNELAVQKTMSDINYLKAIKYGVYDHNEIKDELDGIDRHNLNCVIYKVKKLDADRKFVKKIMIATYMSLGLSFTYEPLVNCNTSIEELQLYRAALLEEENKNKTTCKEVCRQVKKQRNHFKTLAYDSQAVIDKLRTQVGDSTLYSEVRSRYIDNWQNARTEQHTQTIYATENIPATAIENYKQKSEHELRIHTEVETLVSIVITEKLAEVDNWMNKYDKDTEAQELKIAIMKNRYHDAQNKRKELEETYDTHVVLMKNWLQYKADRQAAIDYREKMTNCAETVQAWWRGLLVRLEIGPYKPVRKGKKNNK